MRFNLRVAALLSFAFLVPLLLPAQEFRATITGRVTDTSGAVVPSAKVQVLNQGTNAVTSTVSDSSGIYTLPLLQPGTYTVSATATGFKKYVRANIVLNTGDVTGVDVQMEVGEIQQTVTVTAETPLLETQSATLGFVVNNADVTELPLNGRNPYMLASLSPSVNYNGSQQFQRPYDNGAIANWSINGGLQNMNEFLLDGAPNNAQAGGNNLAWVIPVDATAEFKIQTTTYDAEYGKTAGGIVNITTKAGTDQYHGTGYEFLRRTPLDAIPPADATLTAAAVAAGSTTNYTPVDYLNQYGFSLGGPAKIPELPKLLHGKTFFFVNYERYYQDNPQATNVSVPTMQEMGLEPGELGVYDFSGLDNPATDGGTPITIYNPFTTGSGPTAAATISGTTATRSPFLIPNPFFGGTCPAAPAKDPLFSCETTSPNIQGIPSNLINPIALMIGGYLPTATQNGIAAGGATRRYGLDDFGLSAAAGPFLGNGEDHFYNFISRVDQDFGASDKVFLRFGADDRHQQSEGGDGVVGLGTTGQNPLIRANYQIAGDWTHTVSPTLITDLRLSESQYVEATDSTADATATPAILGFSPSVVSQIHFPNEFGQYSITNYSNLGKDTNSTNFTNTFAIAAKVIKVSGPHTYKFGLDLRWIQENYLNNGNNFDFGFGDNWLQGPSVPTTGASGTAAAQGDGLASLLLGLPTSFESDNLVQPSYLTRYYAGYFQDDWRVNSKLSLDLGLRYDVHPPVSEGHDALTDGFAFNQVNPVNAQVQAAVAAFNPTGTANYTAAEVASFKQYFPNGLPPIMGGLNYVGSSGKSAVMTDWTGIQPRIGLAYQVNQKLVLRGGWARYMINPTNDWYQNPPPGYNQNTSFGPASGLQNPSYAANLVPFGTACTAATTAGCAGNLLTNPFAIFGAAGVPHPTGNALLSQTQLGNTVNFFNPRFHLASVGEFSAGIQYSLPLRSRIEITYVGNRGYKLEANNTYNVIPLALRQQCDPLEVLALNAGSTAPLATAPSNICNTALPNPFYNLPQFAGSGLNTPTTTLAQLALPFPEFSGSGVESGLNLGKMWYNGLIALYTVHAGAALTLNVAYTYSNTLESGGYPTASGGNNQNSDAGEAYTDVQRGVLERSPASWDLPNVVTINAVWQLPFGKGKRFAGNSGRLMNELIGGWEYNANTMFQSGRPQALPSNVEFFPNGMNGTAPAAIPVSWKSGPNLAYGVRPCVATMSSTGVLTLESYSVANTTVSGASNSACTTSNANFLVNPAFAPISGAGLRTTVIRTQPAFTANMSLAKTVFITERIRFQIRAEAFNAFNTPWLAGTQFNSTVTSSSFGTIAKNASETGSAYQNREIQLGFKVIF